MQNWSAQSLFRRHMKRAFLIAATLLVIAFIVSSVFELPRIQRRVQERVRTLQDLSGIVTNLSVHNELNKQLPPAVIRNPDGKPLHSWRFASAAFLLGDQVQFGFYGQVANLDKAWNSAENRCYVTGPFREYSGSPLSYIDQSRPGNKARFVAVQGPGTAFEDGKNISFADLPRSMILVIETRTDVHWMEPGGDLDIRTVPHHIGAQGGIGPATADAKEFFVAFVDGQVRGVRLDMPFSEFQKFLTIAEAAKHDRNTTFGPYTDSVYP